jgi:hypothetical protein
MSENNLTVTVLVFSIISAALGAEKTAYLAFGCDLELPPFGAAGGEWINGDQQGEMFERSEFSPCRRSSFRHRAPA